MHLTCLKFFCWQKKWDYLIKIQKNQKLIYNTGPTLKLNRVFGNPSVGIGNTYVLSLRSEKVGSNQRGAYGDEIGLARVYDFALESGSYDSNVPNLNEWDIALYDVQPVTDITLNEPVTLATSTYVKGANSGATGFLKDAVTAGIAVTIYDREGDFQKDERLIFSRTNTNGSTIARVATAVTAHSLSDVKSVFGYVIFFKSSAEKKKHGILRNFFKFNFFSLYSTFLFC